MSENQEKETSGRYEWEENIYLVVKSEGSYYDSYGDIPDPPDPYDIIMGVYADPSEALMYANDLWSFYTETYEDVPLIEGEDWMPIMLAPASVGFEIKWQLGLNDFKCVRDVYISVIKVKIGSHMSLKPLTDDVKGENHE